MPVKKIFLGTSKSLPELAAARLLANVGPLTILNKILVAVPGNYAAEKLQENLAALAPRGLIAPQIMTPGVLLHCGTAAANTPSALENELIWCNVAETAAKSGCFDMLFPAYNENTPVSGGAFSRLRLELAAGGFSIADAADNLGTRAEQLVEIEQLYIEELEKLGFTDKLSADRNAAEDIDFFQDFDKIILCGMTDIPNLLKKRIENIEKSFPDKLEAWIFADTDKADYFDFAGAAVPEKWNTVPFNISDFEQHVHCVETISDAADKLIDLISANGKLDFDETAIVLSDPTLFPVFKRKLARWAECKNFKLELYDPSGVYFHKQRTYKLGSALLDFCKSDNEIEDAIHLIKNQDMLDYLAHTLKVNTNSILKKLDKFMLEVLPAELSNATGFLEDNSSKHHQIAQIFDVLAKIIEQYNKLSAAEFLRKIFTDIYRHNRAIDRSIYNGVPFKAECQLLQDSLEKLEKSSANANYDKKQLLDIFWKQLGQEKLPSIPGNNPLSVQGCLELPFIDEKNIYFCGVNAEFFPDRISPTTYLTDSIRFNSGIRSNQDTFARAASHLYGLSKMAENGRNLQMITMKKNIDNAPLSPTPLFFSGNLPDKELLKRSHIFFKKSDTVNKKISTNSSKQNYFTLTPALEYRTHPEYPGVPILSVTALSSYIRNPLEYFLGSIMKMDETDYNTKEPDEMNFGTLVHEIFERLNTDVFHSAQDYNSKLQQLLNQVMRDKYGKSPSPLLELVKENISQRLEYTSEILYQCHCKGHYIPLETEYIIGGEQKCAPLYLTLNDTPDIFVSGKIDRIEYSPERNMLRIVDFKTGKKEHIEKILKPFSSDRNKIKLTDLQMPLYAHLLKNDKDFAAKHPEIDMNNVSICCAYIVLPKTVTDTSLLEWESSELAEVIPYALKKVLDITNEIKQWKNMKMSLKGQSSKNYKNILLPDVELALPKIEWIESMPEEYTCNE